MFIDTKSYCSFDFLYTIHLLSSDVGVELQYKIVLSQ